MFNKQLLLISLLLVLMLKANAANWLPSAHSWGGSLADSADAVALDGSGNVYVVGATQSFGSGQGDVLILKYDQTGQFLWAKTWGSSGDEYGAAIKVGPDGYLYVTGGTSSFGAGWYDMFLLKLDTNGNLSWGTTWGGASYESAHDIGFDSTGNIYVVGESYSTSPCCSAILLKFSPAGGLLNQTFYKGPATYDAGYSLTVDSNFNVIVSGISWDYSYNPLHNSMLLLKYDPSGNLLWQENYSTAFPSQDEAYGFHSLTTDTAGNIYVGGRHSNQCQNSNFGLCDFDLLLLKLDPNGNFLWAKTWGAAGTYDTIGSVLLNEAQAPMVSGIKDDYGTPSLFLLGYDTAGNLISQTGWQGGNVQQGSAAGMASDASGSLYLASSALNNQGAWAATTDAASSLQNSLATNTYSIGAPGLSTTSVTTATVDQTSAGVQDTGGGSADSFISKVVTGGTWTRIAAKGPKPLQASNALLLTDGSVLVQGYCLPAWWRLTPDVKGQYVSGTWSKFPNSKLQSGYYGPLFYASAVLPSGLVIIEGGEYTFEDSGCITQVETNKGAIFAPSPYWNTTATSIWTEVLPPQGWDSIGDAPSIVLEHGLFMLGNNNTKSQALTRTGGGWLTPSELGKTDNNSEEGWTLLPNGDVLTLDLWDPPHTERFSNNTWPFYWFGSGETPMSLVNQCTASGGSGPEIGPAVLRPGISGINAGDPTVFAIGGNGHTAVYDVTLNQWFAGPDDLAGISLGTADGPAALLPSGNVLIDTSPVVPCIYKAGSQFFEFDGEQLKNVGAPPNAAADASFQGRMLVLPTGQILFTDGSADVEIYTPTGQYQDNWRPTISRLTDQSGMHRTNSLKLGGEYMAFGTQFNGFSQGAFYGDDAQSATNYPLIRINQAGKTFYARTHDHSTMAVATGPTEVFTYFDMPPPCTLPTVCLVPGAASLVVVANGIPSKPWAVTLE